MADLDMGVEPVDTQQVVIPGDEGIREFTIALSPDRKWGKFPLKTNHRSLEISPGNDGQQDFGIMCQRVKAMFLTTEGKAVIQALKAKLRKVPLVLKTQIVESVGEEV